MLSAQCHSVNVTVLVPLLCVLFVAATGPGGVPCDSSEHLSLCVTVSQYHCHCALSRPCMYALYAAATGPGGVLCPLDERRRGCSPGREGCGAPRNCRARLVQRSPPSFPPIWGGAHGHDGGRAWQVMSTPPVSHILTNSRTECSVKVWCVVCPGSPVLRALGRKPCAESPGPRALGPGSPVPW